MSPVAARMQTLEWEVGLSLCALLGLGAGAGGEPLLSFLKLQAALC